MDENKQAILAEFQLDGKAIDCQHYGQGHINETYLVTTTGSKRYILQKISRTAFPDVDGLMKNIVGVTEFLRQKDPDPRAAMHIVRTNGGKPYLQKDEECWRVYEFVEGTVSLQAPETDRDFYESAVGFGRFISQLADYPAATLHESIPNFHNTPDRYRIFSEVLKRDPMGRAKNVEREVAFVLEHQQEMAALQAMLSAGELPLRVTHNDTKLNNVLLDQATGRPVCVVDLDTVMPGFSVYDFGDAIRSGASTAAEDEKDFTRARVDTDFFEAFSRGFLHGCRGGLTSEEIRLLPVGAMGITLECGMRFLTDYLLGDTYFHCSRPGQNLDRCRVQFHLVQDMLEQEKKLCACIKKMI